MTELCVLTARGKMHMGLFNIYADGVKVADVSPDHSSNVESLWVYVNDGWNFFVSREKTVEEILEELTKSIQDNLERLQTLREMYDNVRMALKQLLEKGCEYAVHLLEEEEVNLQDKIKVLKEHLAQFVVGEL